MAITVLLQKTTASYMPRFNFGGPFLVWCGPESEPDDDCPWYKAIGCTALVAAAVADCTECVGAPWMCETCTLCDCCS